MTRRTFFLASFWILLLAVLVLIWQLATVHSQRDFLQKSVDERFVSHFSLLCDSLFSQDPVDTDTARASAQVCTSLFPLSSYGADESLQNILLSLKQMVPPDQIYLPSVSPSLADAIGALRLHMEDTAQTDAVWAALSASLKILPAA
ncbi:MAG: hypothetical protein KH420_01695 [Clostridiales bacterium]|nr:hypothetical protein [Clostridiales bacterium]